MEYKILRIDDRGTTATVEMSIAGRVLNQNFPLGKNSQELKAAIEKGMAVFNEEHKAREAESQDIGAYNTLLNEVQIVDKLPEINLADFKTVDNITKENIK